MPNPYDGPEKLAYQRIILRILEDDPNRWFNNWELRELSFKGGWVGSTGDRRCRELAEKGLINRKMDGRYVIYAHLPSGICANCANGDHQNCQPDPTCGCGC